MLGFDFRPLNVFIFIFFNNNFYSFNSEIYLKKKGEPKRVVLAQLTAADNWGLTEYRIDNNWKLEDWNEKCWKLEN